MAVEVGVNLILDGLGRAFALFRETAGYHFTPKVDRRMVDLAALSKSEAPGLFYEVADEGAESRESQLGPFVECSLPVEVVLVLWDPEPTSVFLNLMIRDALKLIQSRDWDVPSWQGGQGSVRALTIASVERYVSAESALKIAVLGLTVDYREPWDLS